MCPAQRFSFRSFAWKSWLTFPASWSPVKKTRRAKSVSDRVRPASAPSLALMAGTLRSASATDATSTEWSTRESQPEPPPRRLGDLAHAVARSGHGLVGGAPFSDPERAFVAIDFETATRRRDSACAVGLAVGHRGRVVLSRSYLIRPPSSSFTFTGIHGLGWKDVRDQPTFEELWPRLRPWIASADFLVAHNWAFDRSVLHACCSSYGLRPPLKRFVFTVHLARAQWGIRPTTLPDVCHALKIPLRHHDAEADAIACAHIVLAAAGRLGQRSRQAAH